MSNGRSAEQLAGTLAKDAFGVDADAMQNLCGWANGLDGSRRLSVQHGAAVGVKLAAAGFQLRRYLLAFLSHLFVSPIPFVGETVSAYSLSDASGPGHAEYQVVRPRVDRILTIALNDQSFVLFAHFYALGRREEGRA